MFRLLETLSVQEAAQLDRLRQWFQTVDAVCVAYSGGVDSTLVATLAFEQKGNSALAITGVSPALAPHLLEEARAQAAWIGIRHQECRTMNSMIRSTAPIPGIVALPVSGSCTVI